MCSYKHDDDDDEASEYMRKLKLNLCDASYALL